MVGTLELKHDNPIVQFLIWDFDGTLGYREGRWASTLHVVLEEAMPGYGFEKEFLGAQLRRGSPLHTPEVPPPELSSLKPW